MLANDNLADTPVIIDTDAQVRRVGPVRSSNTALHSPAPASRATSSACE
jgi:hypothetical protein